MRVCCANCRHVERFSDWREQVDAFFEQAGWCRDFAGLSRRARRCNHAYLVVYLPEYACANFTPLAEGEERTGTGERARALGEMSRGETSCGKMSRTDRQTRGACLKQAD